MTRFVPLSKKSKKEQKKFHAMQRRTWGETNLVTRSVPNGKAYNRKKMKQRDMRNGSYFRDENSCRFSFTDRNGGNLMNGYNIVMEN